MGEPVLRADASPGGILHRFLLDEQANAEHAIHCLDVELTLIDRLDELYCHWLFPADPHRLRKGETIYFAFCSLTRTQVLKACADLLRYEIGEAFGSARVAAEAAFYALMVSVGKITEDDYFEKPHLLS